jgi:hypothetical protein
MPHEHAFHRTDFVDQWPYARWRYVNLSRDQRHQDAAESQRTHRARRSALHYNAAGECSADCCQLGECEPEHCVRRSLDAAGWTIGSDGDLHSKQLDPIEALVEPWRSLTVPQFWNEDDWAREVA